MNQNHVMVGEGSTVGPYELLECIGRGGMADVYLGIKRSVSDIRRFYAIKAIRPHMAVDERFVRMLVDEARVMASIRHPNLVNLHEVLEERGSYFIIMEFLRGIDLRRMGKELVHNELKLPLPVAMSIIRQAGHGLHYAHEAKSIDGAPMELVHRDVSTHNIFVTFDGFVRVLDFGIAQSSVRQEVSESGVLKGKIPYLSPEQCAGLELDRRTDVYSLGVVLYELTTGRRPFAGSNEMQVIQSVVNHAPPRPVSLNSAIPRGLEDVILKALHKDRDQRFQTTEELSDAVERVSMNESWRIGERVVSAFIRCHYREHMESLDRRLAELAATALAGTRRSDLMEVDYDDIEESRLDLGTDAFARSRRIGGFTTFKLTGDLRESFEYDPILARTRGAVVLDLAGIKRLTSFGIRQWLEMLPRLRNVTDRVIISRMPETFVNQAVTIPKMTQGVEIASLLAPYLCRHCFHAFTHCIEAGQTIPFQIMCPRCERREAELDEDPSYLTPLSNTEPIDDELALLLDELIGDEDQHEARIEKRVIGRMTEILVTGEVPDTTRWDRYLAGVEGEVRVSFEPGALISDDSLKRLCVEVRKVEGDADLGIWNLPVHPDEHELSAIPRLSSVSFPSKCSACGTEQFREWILDGDTLDASCRTCGAPLEQEISNSIRSDASKETNLSSDATYELEAQSEPTPSNDVPREPSRTPSRKDRSTIFFVLVVLFLLIAIAAIALL